MKKRCENCIYRGEVPNSIHSSCNHPVAINIISDSDSLFRMMECITGESRLGYTGSLRLKLKENYEDYALGMGYFIFPINFDPLWIERCEGFTTEKPVLPGELCEEETCRNCGTCDKG